MEIEVFLEPTNVLDHDDLAQYPTPPLDDERCGAVPEDGQFVNLEPMVKDEELAPGGYLAPVLVSIS